MGILESDLVKVGVDILTKFLEIINKATSAFDGLGGSIMKIMTVVSLFKLGQKIFDKFKAPLAQFFTDIVKMSRESGYESGKAFTESVGKAKEEAESKQTSDKVNSIKQEASRTVGQDLLDKTGLGDIVTGGKKVAAGGKEEKDKLYAMAGVSAEADFKEKK
jgi:hypothetical protein